MFGHAADGSVAFHHLPPPSDADVAELAARIVRRTARVLARQDAIAGDDQPPDALALAQADAVQLPLALSDRHAERAPPPRRSLCAFVDGFSLHAATFVPPDDRAALERLLRYILRPAVVAERISLRDDGRVELAFRKPDPTGRTSWVTDGVELCRRLATLIPPKRVHGVRYHGVFSGAHKLRRHIVPTAPLDADGGAPQAAPSMSVLARRLDWAALLERVFGPDVTQCPRCGDRLSVLAFITDPDVTSRILAHLGLDTEPGLPPLAPARAPPEPWFDDVA